MSGLDEMEAIFDLDEGTYPIKVTGDSDVNSAIVSIGSSKNAMQTAVMLKT